MRLGCSHTDPGPGRRTGTIGGWGSFRPTRSSAISVVRVFIPLEAGAGFTRHAARSGMEMNWCWRASNRALRTMPSQWRCKTRWCGRTVRVRGFQSTGLKTNPRPRLSQRGGIKPLHERFGGAEAAEAGVAPRKAEKRAVSAVTIERYATCCSDTASPSEASESQIHASWANHSCVTRQSGQ